MVEEKYNELILFDGVCNLCNGFVQFVLKNEKTKVLKFTSLQSDIGVEIFPEQKLDSIAFVKNGVVYTKSKAVLQILSYLTFPWKVFTVFKILPKFISDFFYDIIAKNRYRLFGKKEACWLPTPDFKSRFV